MYKKRKVLQNVQDSKIYIYPTNFIPYLTIKSQVLYLVEINYPLSPKFIKNFELIFL